MRNGAGVRPPGVHSSLLAQVGCSRAHITKRNQARARESTVRASLSADHHYSGKQGTRPSVQLEAFHIPDLWENPAPMSISGCELQVNSSFFCMSSSPDTRTGTTRCACPRG